MSLASYWKRRARKQLSVLIEGIEVIVDDRMPPDTIALVSSNVTTRRKQLNNFIASARAVNHQHFDYKVSVVKVPIEAKREEFDKVTLVIPTEKKT